MSEETQHVLPPDLANLWVFKLGEKKVISKLPGGADGLTLTLDELEAERGLFTMWVHHFPDPLTDHLKIDAPIIALRLPNGEPAVTFTLRSIVDGCAFVQISAHPSLSQTPNVQ